MQNLIIRKEQLESQGILVKNAKCFTYKGNLFKEGVSFSQHHRQLAIDMLRQQSAHGKLCILVENDHILTFYHQHSSSTEIDAVTTIVEPSRQKASLHRSEVVNPDNAEQVSQISPSPKQDKPPPSTHSLRASASNLPLPINNSQKYPMHMSSDSPNWLRRLTSQISQEQDLQAIFKTAVEDLRPFLEIDRVKICQFQPDGRGQIIAEAIYSNRLPSILALRFPQIDLSPYPKELLRQVQGGVMINLKTKTICKMLSSPEDMLSSPVEKTNYLPVDSHYAKALTDMGVKFSIVIPILYNETVWGMLIAHHSETHFVSTRKFEVLQIIIDQLSVAIAQQTLRAQTQIKVEQEAIFNQIVNRLQASPNPEFQPALETAVAVFQGSGGRLCMSDQTQTLPDGSAKQFAACLASSGQEVKVYTCGAQPNIPAMINSTLMEQYRLWQDHYQSGYYQVWPIENIYQTPELHPLFDAFRSTSICSLLMIPLTYRQQLLGYLSIFRNSVTSNTPQTTERDGPAQPVQGQAWTDLELAQRLGQQFAVAIHEYKLSQQLHSSNTHLNSELQQQTVQLQQVAQQQQGLSELLVKIKAAVDPETIFQTTTKELCHLLNAERVAVYRFNADWGGEFVHDFEYVVSTWQRASKLGRNTAWNDTYLQQTEGGRYRYNETFSADNIYEANLSSCHVEILEQFHIKAFSTAPVFVAKKLWGVLAAYQHSQVRNWLTTDILFLSQTASALGIALQQAELLAHNQNIIKPYQTVPKEFDLGGRSLPSG